MLIYSRKTKLNGHHEIVDPFTGLMQSTLDQQFAQFWYVFQKFQKSMDHSENTAMSIPSFVHAPNAQQSEILPAGGSDLVY